MEGLEENKDPLTAHRQPVDNPSTSSGQKPGEKTQDKSSGQGKKNWFKRLGWGAIFFFTIKGLVWLAIFFGVGKLIGC